MHRKKQNRIRPLTYVPRSVLAFALVLIGLCCSSTRAQFYAVTDLGTLGGANGMAYSINSHEQIVGAAQTGIGNYHAFMFDAGRMIDLGTLGGSNSWAYGINDMGWMVGAADLPMTNMHAFLCTNGLVNPMMMDTGTLGGSNSAAWMIDMYGDMVGWAAMTNGTHHAFFMTNSVMGDMMDLGTAGGTNSQAYCINSNRMVVGYSMMSNGTMEPIMSTNATYGSSSMMTMGMGGMGAVSGGRSWSVNNMGDTAGEAEMSGGNHHAIASGSGGMMGQRTVDLGTLGGSNSLAYCINDSGAVVGTAQLLNGTMHAFMVTNALGTMVHMMDLNDLIPTNSNWELMEARGMNKAGQIVGWGMFGRHTNAFLLTPVSAPVVMMSAPASQIVGLGTTAGLRMQMTTDEALTYQWFHNGVPVSNGTNSTLTLSNMSMVTAGQYTVAVRNAVGTVAYSSSTLSLFDMQSLNGMPHLTIAAAVGSRFQIDSLDSLGTTANWQTVTNFTMTDSTTQIQLLPQPGVRARFYRATLVP